MTVDAVNQLAAFDAIKKAEQYKDIPGLSMLWRKQAEKLKMEIKDIPKTIKNYYQNWDNKIIDMAPSKNLAIVITLDKELAPISRDIWSLLKDNWKIVKEDKND